MVVIINDAKTILSTYINLANQAIILIEDPDDREQDVKIFSFDKVEDIEYFIEMLTIIKEKLNG